MICSLSMRLFVSASVCVCVCLFKQTRFSVNEQQQSTDYDFFDSLKREGKLGQEKKERLQVEWMKRGYFVGDAEKERERCLDKVKSSSSSSLSTVWATSLSISSKLLTTAAATSMLLLLLLFKMQSLAEIINRQTFALSSFPFYSHKKNITWSYIFLLVSGTVSVVCSLFLIFHRGVGEM